MQETTIQNTTTDELNEACPVILRYLEHELGSGVFNLWFLNTHFIVLNEKSAVLGVQNRFIKNWIEKQYSSAIIAAIKHICNTDPVFSIKIDGALFKEQTNTSQTDSVKTSLDINPSAGDHPIKAKRTIDKNKQKYTLDAFIGLKDNSLPLLISKQFVENLKSPLYHRLTLFGPKGNGKTHLLKGIQALMYQEYGDLTIQYLTAESFTNQYVHAIQSKQFTAFQKRFSNLDILILDDIQFLAGKTKTQEGLLSTIKHLESEGHSVALACDRHPSDVPGLSPDLRELISAGMLIEVPAPCYDGRMAILKSLCCKSSTPFPETVLTFLAEHFYSSVRELEGALVKVIAYSSLCKKPASIELARQILQPHLRTTQIKKDNVDAMLADVAAIFAADPADLISRKQDRSTTRSRQIAMYVIRRLTGKPYQEIGSYFGGKKYSAVMYAEKMAQKTIDNDPNVARHIDAILKRYQ